MAGLNIVNNAVRSIQTVEGYINVGMDICTEVALDFVENKNGDSDNDVVEFRKIMLNFAKMERELKQVQEAVEFVKTQPEDSELTLEEIFDRQLKEAKKGDKDNVLLQHEKIQDFNQKLFEALHPDEAYSASVYGFPPSAAGGDDEVEMTQEQINTKCPYSGAEMVNPVRNKHCGHNYEKDAIMTYIQQRKKRAKLESCQEYIPKSIIARIMKPHGCIYLTKGECSVKCPVSACPNEKPVEALDLEDNKELKRYIERMNREAKRKQKK